ncbi:MAG: hypothetical protein ACXU8N_19180 [Telluria sp.]
MTRNETYPTPAVSQIAVPVPADLFLELAAHLAAAGDGRDPVAAVAAAIRASLAAERAARAAGAEPDGYQWKCLFLPEGTVLRVLGAGGAHYATVVGHRLLYRGMPTSPNRLAAASCARTARNAWNQVWLRWPGGADWLPAWRVRAEREAALRSGRRSQSSLQSVPRSSDS